MSDQVRELNDCKEEFLKYLVYQSQFNTDRNKEWFPKLIKKLDQYPLVTIVFRNDKIIAFSAIQDHFFPPQTVRVLTRTFFDQSIRLKPGFDFMAPTPVKLMAEYQLKWLSRKPNYERALITMETRYSRAIFRKIISKINTHIGTNFLLLDHTIQTYPQQPRSLFQHGAYLDLK